MPRPEYESVACRRRDEVPARLKKLAETISKDLGVPVAAVDALRIAVDEALERRKAKPDI